MFRAEATKGQALITFDLMQNLRTCAYSYTCMALCSIWDSCGVYNFSVHNATTGNASMYGMKPLPVAVQMKFAYAFNCIWAPSLHEKKNLFSDDDSYVTGIYRYKNIFSKLTTNFWLRGTLTFQMTGTLRTLRRVRTVLEFLSQQTGRKLYMNLVL